MTISLALWAILEKSLNLDRVIGNPYALAKKGQIGGCGSLENDRFHLAKKRQHQRRCTGKMVYKQGLEEWM